MGEAKFRVYVDAGCPLNHVTCQYLDFWDNMQFDYSGNQVTELFPPAYGSTEHDVHGSSVAINSLELIFFHESVQETDLTTHVQLPHPSIRRIVVFLDKKSSMGFTTNLQEVLEWDPGSFFPFLGLPRVATMDRYQILYDSLVSVSAYGEFGGNPSSRVFIKFDTPILYTFHKSTLGNTVPDLNSLYIGVVGTGTPTFYGRLYVHARTRFTQL